MPLKGGKMNAEEGKEKKKTKQATSKPNLRQLHINTDSTGDGEGRVLIKKA